MTEKLTGGDFFVQRTAVKRHKRPFRALAVLVNEARQQFFAGTGLALYQNRFIYLIQFSNFFLNFDHFRAAADNQWTIILTLFITAALFSRLENEDQLAGIIGHEIGHVIERHGAERMAKIELTQGLTGAAVIASGDYSTAQAAQMIGNLINMKFGRDQELECDDWGVRMMIEAGYDPREMINVMRILKESAGGRQQPEFFSTHPDPDNRAERILEAIERHSR